MRKTQTLQKSVKMVVMCFLIITIITPMAGFAAQITVQGNKNITLTGKKLMTHCANLTIAEGSSVILNAGSSYPDLGRRNGSGTLVHNGGVSEKCYKTMTIIKKPDGTPGAVLIF